MRTITRLVTAFALGSFVAAGALASKAPDFTQTTQAQGKLPPDLGGTWLLYAQAQLPGGATRALAPELVAVSQKGQGDLALRILDVQFPKSIDEPYKAANRRRQAWEPTPEDLALLRKQWSKLPPATKKDMRAGDVVYDRVEFALAGPDKYTEVFPDVEGSVIGDALKGSVFAFRVTEKYRAQQLQPGENVAQVMERKSVYVVQHASDSVLEGKQYTGFLAAGPGVPLPISLNGTFKLYRLAKAAPAPQAAKPKKGSPAPR